MPESVVVFLGFREAQNELQKCARLYRGMQVETFG